MVKSKLKYWTRGLSVLVFLLLAITGYTQQATKYFRNYRYIGKFDLVSYFEEGKAIKGKKKYQVVVDGVPYRFSTEDHLQSFIRNPSDYLPQYGGYCAYAMGKTGKFYRINPRSFEVVDGKLYLFYHSFFLNIKKKWQHEGPEKLRKQADDHWRENN